MQVSASGVKQLKHDLEGKGKHCFNGYVKAPGELSAPKRLLTAVKSMVSRAAGHREVGFLSTIGVQARDSQPHFPRLRCRYMSWDLGLLK